MDIITLKPYNYQHSGDNYLHFTGQETEAQKDSIAHEQQSGF